MWVGGRLSCIWTGFPLSVSFHHSSKTHFHPTSSEQPFGPLEASAVHRRSLTPPHIKMTMELTVQHDILSLPELSRHFLPVYTNFPKI
jgi:hypothetical protein